MREDDIDDRQAVRNLAQGSPSTQRSQSVFERDFFCIFDEDQNPSE